MAGATSVMPKKPSTTEGMPASTSISGFSTSRAQAGATSRTNTAVATPSGTAITHRDQRHEHGAEDERHGAEAAEGRVPRRAEEVVEPHRGQHGQALAQQEQEDQQHEADGGEAEHPDDGLGRELGPPGRPRGSLLHRSPPCSGTKPSPVTRPCPSPVTKSRNSFTAPDGLARGVHEQRPRHGIGPVDHRRGRGSTNGAPGSRAMAMVFWSCVT